MNICGYEVRLNVFPWHTLNRVAAVVCAIQGLFDIYAHMWGWAIIQMILAFLNTWIAINVTKDGVHKFGRVL